MPGRKKLAHWSRFAAHGNQHIGPHQRALALLESQYGTRAAHAYTRLLHTASRSSLRVNVRRYTNERVSAKLGIGPETAAKLKDLKHKNCKQVEESGRDSRCPRIL